MASSNGGEKLDITSKARLKTHFIGTKQYWGESFGQGVKGIVKWKRLSDAVVGSPPWTIASTDSSNMDDANQSLLLEIFKYQENSFQNCIRATKPKD